MDKRKSTKDKLKIWLAAKQRPGHYQFLIHNTNRRRLPTFIEDKPCIFSNTHRVIYHSSLRKTCSDPESNQARRWRDSGLGFTAFLLNLDTRSRLRGSCRSFAHDGHNRSGNDAVEIRITLRKNIICHWRYKNLQFVIQTGCKEVQKKMIPP